MRGGSQAFSGTFNNASTGEVRKFAAIANGNDLLMCAYTDYLASSGNWDLLKSQNKLITVKGGGQSGQGSLGITLSQTPPEPVNEIRGTDEGEWLIGTDGKDAMWSGAGNDIVRGHGGNDIYNWGRGDGNDIFHDFNENAQDHDILRLNGLNVSDVVFHRDGNNLLIRILDTNDVLDFRDQFLASQKAGVETIEFADGTVWNWEKIKDVAEQHVNIVNGADGQFWVDGTNGKDIIWSGAGDDFMRGFGGSDIYLWGRGDGNDRMEDWGYAEDHDVIRLTNLNPSDVDMIRVGNDLMIRIKETGERLDVLGHFLEDREWSIETIEFADGTTWNKDQIAQNAPFGLNEIRGTDEAEYVLGGNGDDRLISGAGNDIVRGYGGSDVYHWGRGDGDDWFHDWNDNADDIDVLKLIDLNISDVVFYREGNDLRVRINDTGELLRVQDQFLASQKAAMERIEFADGTTWNWEQIKEEASKPVTIHGTDGDDVLHGHDSNDVFWSGAGNDRMVGAHGSDTYHWGRGDGNDIIHDENINENDHDVLKLVGLNISDVAFYREGTDLRVRILDTNEILRVVDHFYPHSSDFAGVESVEFADGTVWNWEKIKDVTEQYVNVVNGTDGNETLEGTNGNDIFWTGAGNDVAHGREGSDIYNWGRGDGNDIILEFSSTATDHDILRLTDLNASDVEMVKRNDDLLIHIKNTGELLTVLYQFDVSQKGGVESIEFADGTTWNWDQIEQATAAPQAFSAMSAFSAVADVGINDTFVFHENFETTLTDDIAVSVSATTHSSDFFGIEEETEHFVSPLFSLNSFNFESGDFTQYSQYSNVNADNITILTHEMTYWVPTQDDFSFAA